MKGSIVVIACVAGIARAEPPPLEGHVTLGVRVTSTDLEQFDIVDEKTGLRAAADGLVGLRAGRAVLGVHLGFATPLHFSASPQHDSGERVAETDSDLYPVDLGFGVQADAGAGFWGSAWVGVTVTIARASSPAAHIDAIDFTGDIPADSWIDRTTGLGYGAAIGYDIHAHWAALLTFTSESIAEVPNRRDDGTQSSDTKNLTCRSLTAGAAYRF